MKYLFLLAASLGFAAPAVAQSAPSTTYEFMVVVEIQSQTKYASQIIFAPAFQGKTEVPLEVLPGELSKKYWPTYEHNLEVVTQQLQAVTAAGWELANSTTHTTGQQYLFRRAKK